MPETPLQTNLLAPLATRLELAERAYRDYLTQGKTFFLASILREHNIVALQIAVENGRLLPADRKSDLVHLVAHLEAWLALWTEHRDRNKPANDEVFVFESSLRFPTESVRRLLE
jgi:hypothetical protein